MDPYLIYVLSGLGFLLLIALLRWALNDPGKHAPEESAPATDDEPDVDADADVEDVEEPPEPVAAPDPVALIEVLRGGEPGPCREAVKVLVEIGEDALPVLEAALEEDDPDLQFDVRRALRLIKGELPD